LTSWSPLSTGGSSSSSPPVSSRLSVPKLAGRWAWSQASSGSKGSKGPPEARADALVPMEPLKFMNRLEKEAYFRRHQHYSEHNEASKVVAYKKSPAQTPKFLLLGDREKGEEGMERSLASVAVGGEESSSTGSGNGLVGWSKGWRKMVRRKVSVHAHGISIHKGFDAHTRLRTAIVQGTRSSTNSWKKTLLGMSTFVFGMSGGRGVLCFRSLSRGSVRMEAPGRLIITKSHTYTHTSSVGHCSVHQAFAASLPCMT
jgi:hypothetical protein